jgi:hypothetical protein
MILLLIACLSPVTGVQTDAGKATFDLGDGYRASFELPNIGNSYELDYAYDDKVAKNEIMKYNEYGFMISSKGNDLATVTMKVYSDPQIEYLPKPHTEPSFAPDTVGPRIITPKTIGGSLGYIGYDLPAGGTGTDISKAISCFFKYYPGSWEELGDVKGLFEVYGETSGLPSSAESVKVINSLINSIKITGPGIK